MYLGIKTVDVLLLSGPLTCASLHFYYLLGYHTSLLSFLSLSLSLPFSLSLSLTPSPCFPPSLPPSLFSPSFSALSSHILALLLFLFTQDAL